MRQLQSLAASDYEIQRALGELNANMAKLGIEESDVVSVSVLTEPPAEPKVGGMSRMTKHHGYEIVVMYWSAD
jgi:hypothetical protein